MTQMNLLRVVIPAEAEIHLSVTLCYAVDYDAERNLFHVFDYIMQIYHLVFSFKTFAPFALFRGHLLLLGFNYYCRKDAQKCKKDKFY